MQFSHTILFLKFCQKYICFVILFVLNLKFSRLNADLRRRYPCMMTKTHLVKKKEKSNANIGENPKKDG
jgi:hypothetical protein